jgi:hexokinase
MGNHISFFFGKMKKTVKKSRCKPENQNQSCKVEVLAKNVTGVNFRLVIIQLADDTQYTLKLKER